MRICPICTVTEMICPACTPPARRPAVRAGDFSGCTFGPPPHRDIHVLEENAGPLGIYQLRYLRIPGTFEGERAVMLNSLIEGRCGDLYCEGRDCEKWLVVKESHLRRMLAEIEAARSAP